MVTSEQHTVNDEHFQALIERATDLAEADEHLLYSLIRIRRDAGLSQQDVADRLGWTAKKVARFERYDSDPRLSTIRRYALAVGASITHSTARIEQ